MAEPGQRFEAALAVASRLVERGNAQLLVVPSLGPRPVVSFGFRRQDPEVVKELSAADLSVNDFGRELGQITEMLTSAVHGRDENQFVKLQSAQRSAQAGEAEGSTDEGETRRRYALVSEAFDLNDLRRREWLKRTAKDPGLVSIGWEASTKTADAEHPPPEGPPLGFGVLRMEVATSATGPMAIFSSPMTRLTIAVDRSDVAGLRAALQQLDEELAKLET